MRYLTKWIGDNKGFLLFLALMFVFRSACADWNEVPTGSMKPTVVEGDRVLVNKMAYDIRFPFTKKSLFKISDPKRGDIVVFDSKQADKRLLKRVVGVPGDSVKMLDNVLYINDLPLEYERVSLSAHTEQKVENLLGVKHPIQVSPVGSVVSSFQAVMMPPNQYLMLGDNRDSSADSRMIGLVPRDEIIGRTKRVILSLDYDNYYFPRAERFLHTL